MSKHNYEEGSTNEQAVPASVVRQRRKGDTPLVIATAGNCIPSEQARENDLPLPPPPFLTLWCVSVYRRQIISFLSVTVTLRKNAAVLLHEKLLIPELTFLLYL